MVEKISLITSVDQYAEKCVTRVAWYKK